MDRREAVKNMAFLMGGALSATTIGVFLEGCSPTADQTGEPLSFTDHQQQLITEIANSIIPDTDTPGAKAAGVGPFIALMIRDCYPEDAQKAFVKGLDELEAASKDEFKKSFLDLTGDQRNGLLTKLREKTIADIKAEQEKLDAQKEADKEKQTANPEKAKSQTENAGVISILPKDKPRTEPRFFAIIRDLTILGYFTSETGATKAMEYVYVPGRYDGCTDLKPGQRAWAS